MPQHPPPDDHRRLHVLAAVARVASGTAAALGGSAPLRERFPFLDVWLRELPDGSLGDPAWWRRAVADFERDTPGHLPLRALREAAGLDHDALTLLAACALPDEDPRFGALFDEMQGTVALLRPTPSLIEAWWRGDDDRGGARSALRRLRALGLVTAANSDAPRLLWGLQVPASVWDAAAGDAPDELAPGLSYRPNASLVPLAGLVAPASLRASLARLPALVAADELRALVVRGPRRCGRRTVLGALAHAVGRGLLEARGLGRPDDPRWASLGALATMLDALPVVSFDLAPGEAVEVPALVGLRGPLGVALGRHGGLRGAGVDGALTLAIDVPTADERRAHWREALGDACGPDLDQLAKRHRMTSGNIRRAGPAARALARADGREQVTVDDARQAARSLHRQALETLATHVPATGRWSQLALPADTTADLRELEARCRQRERLGAHLGAALEGRVNAGVRAIFQGPSGTGKTFAARVLAAALGMDLYRVDLAAVVNKYIGETEKNLHQVLSLAEELDVVLLLDEGDALMGRRTSVQSANDRYANLETNYLLQRIESHEGVVLVTTNAPDHVDAAFHRRMDFVVEFRAPDAAERFAIWQLHLPVEHAVDADLLREVASRCALSGGQIRNAVLHAAALSADAGTTLATRHLEAAVQREYRKVGGVCPLRPSRGRGGG
jgi:hypothetical protein